MLTSSSPLKELKVYSDVNFRGPVRLIEVDTNKEPNKSQKQHLNSAMHVTSSSSI